VPRTHLHTTPLDTILACVPDLHAISTVCPTAQLTLMPLLMGAIAHRDESARERRHSLGSEWPTRHSPTGHRPAGGIMTLVRAVQRHLVGRGHMRGVASLRANRPPLRSHTMDRLGS
jgi:hypothetical protein